MPELVVPKSETDAWLARRGLAQTGRPVVTLAPGAVGPGKAWPPEHYAELARRWPAKASTSGFSGGPNEKAIAAEIAKAGGPNVKDLTGNDLRDAIIAMTIADVAVTNDSGLMHIAAALNTPTIAIFGPTSPRLWSPLNPLAAVIEPLGGPVAEKNIKQRRTADIAPQSVLGPLRKALAERPMPRRMRPCMSAAGSVPPRQRPLPQGHSVMADPREAAIETFFQRLAEDAGSGGERPRTAGSSPRHFGPHREVLSATAAR